MSSYPIVIGVTGHYHLDETKIEAIKKSINTVFDELESRFPDHEMVMMSELAEGADQLAAATLLQRGRDRKRGKMSLHAVLPLPKKEYIQDFSTTSSREEFKNLLASSVKRTVVSKPAISNHDDHRAAYLAAGKHIVNHCSLLLAIWDGRTAQDIGGTGDVVAYAIKRGTPIAWIKADNLRDVTESQVPHQEKSRESLGEPQGTLSWLQWRLDQPDASTIQRIIPGAGSESDFDMSDETDDVPETINNQLAECCSRFQESYRAADHLAIQNKKRHRRIVTIVSAFGSLALALAVYKLASGTHSNLSMATEALALNITIAALVFGRRRRYRQMWIQQRSHAELFSLLKYYLFSIPSFWCLNRTSSFKAIDVAVVPCRKDCTAMRDMEKTIEKIGKLLDGYKKKGSDLLPISNLLESKLEELLFLDDFPMPAKCHLDKETLDALVSYYQRKRLNVQIRFFATRASRNSRRDRITSWLTHYLFYGSVIAELVYIIVVIFEKFGFLQGMNGVGNWLIADAIWMCVIGAGIHEYGAVKDSVHQAPYALKQHLLEKLSAGLSKLMAGNPDPVQVFSLIRRCEERMRAEHEEWLRLMQLAD